MKLPEYLRLRKIRGAVLSGSRLPGLLGIHGLPKNSSFVPTQHELRIGATDASYLLEYRIKPVAPMTEDNAELKAMRRGKLEYWQFPINVLSLTESGLERVLVPKGYHLVSRVHRASACSTQDSPFRPQGAWERIAPASIDSPIGALLAVDRAISPYPLFDILKSLSYNLPWVTKVVVEYEPHQE